MLNTTVKVSARSFYIGYTLTRVTVYTYKLRGGG